MATIAYVGCQCPTLHHSLRTPERGNWKLKCTSPSTVNPSSKVQDVNSSSRVDCVIVGAGISGLCIAQAVAKNHSNLIVTEARDRAGGNITTVERDGYLWEEGPNSFQPSDPMLNLIVDNELKDELVLGDPNAPRFVFWEGKLRPVPSGLADLPFFDLMTFPGKIRAAFGAIGLRPPAPVGLSILYVCSYFFPHLSLFSPAYAHLILSKLFSNKWFLVP